MLTSFSNHNTIYNAVRSASRLTSSRRFTVAPDLRKEELLGEAVADQDGRYKITAKQFQRAEKRSADLKVRVFSPEP